MKKKIITVSILCLIVVLCACLFTSCTKLNENMFPTNGSGQFLDGSVAELSKNFILVTDDKTANTDVFSLSESTTEEDIFELSIDTTSSGYAYIGKKIRLTGGCYYSVIYSLNVTSESEFNAGSAYVGIYPSILEDEDLDFTEYAIHDKTDTLQKYEVVFRAKKTCDATIVLNVATKDAPAKIKMVLDAFSVKRISKNAAEESNYVGEFVSDYYGQVDVFNVFYIVMGAFLTVAVCVAAYIMLRRHFALGDPDNNNGAGYRHPFMAKMNENKWLDIGIFVGIGLIVRLLIDILSSSIAGTFATAKTFISYNAQGLATQALFIAQHGPQYLLNSVGGDFAVDSGYTIMSASSSPLQLYFLGFCGLFGRIFEKSNPYIATLFFIRFFAAIADIGAAYVLYLIVKKHVGKIGATVVSSLYLCLPVVFAASSLWGYTESITALLIILTVKFMLDNNYIGTACSFFVAFLFSQSALFLAPFVAFYTILVCINSVRMKEYKNIIAASSILVLAFFVYYAISVPFAINYIQSGKPFYWFDYAWSELYKGSLYTINAFNFQAMLGNNMTEITTSSLVVTIIFILFLLGLAGFAYFKFKNRMNLILLATAFINMMFVFANDMNPMSMFISLILMLMYAVMNKEKRIFFSFVAFATMMFVNVSYVELMLPFTVSSAPAWSGHLPLMYVFSALEIIFALYYVYIVYDIVVSRKVRKISPLNMTFAASVRNFYLRIAKKYYKFKMEHKKG